MIAREHSKPTVGTRVRIQRDETRYVPKGTWPQFRGKTGTVIEVSTDSKRPHLTEYAVAFGSISARPDGSLRGGNVAWFKVYEMRPLAAVGHAERLLLRHKGKGCRMTATRPNIAQIDRDSLEDGLADTEDRIGSGDEAGEP